MQDKDEKFYGRRKGRPLRVRKSHLMETLLLQLALPEGEAACDPAILATYQPVRMLEIGFGGGEHLAAQAAAHPTVSFIGAEAFVNGVASFLDHADAMNLQNVRVYPHDVRPFLRLMPPGFFQKIFMLFPDPWRKKRHYERRLIQQDSVRWIHDLLAVGGQFVIASDHADYQEWIQEHLDHFTGFKNILKVWKRPADWPETRYEQKARAAGRHCLYMVYEKV